MIREIHIQDFRSFRDEVIIGVTDFFSIAGRNGTGKSNVLRALNLFFNGEIETGVPIDLARDFHRATERKDKRVVRVEVQFELPIPPFHWRHRVAEHAHSLGIEAGVFGLAREWSLDPDTRRVATHIEYQVDGPDWTQPHPDHLDFFQLLLTRLIRYRYVPNHIHPVTLIENERPELQRTLMTRLNRRRSVDDAVDLNAPLDAITSVAAEVIEPVVQHLRQAAPELDAASIATPSTWADIALTLDLELQESGQSSRSVLLHGSGHQSVVSLSMLRLIDTDFSSSFGWHQGTIWGLEEPEAYLHHELVFQVANLLAGFSEHPRFQIFVTTHSPTFMAFSDAGVLIQDSEVRTLAPSELIREVASSGIGPFVHPLLINESKPLLVVKGPSDRQHLEHAYSHLGRPNPWSIVATEDLDLPPGVNGFRHLIQQHQRALRARNAGSPLVALLDHVENLGPLSEELQGIHAKSSAHRWNVEQANPDLDPSEFRGIEAFLSTPSLLAAEQEGLITLMRPAGGVPMGCRDVEKVKIAELLEERQTPEDYALFEPMLSFLESQLTAEPMMMA